MSCNPEKGYHIRHFPTPAQRIAKAGAIISGVTIGEWIAAAVNEKYERDTGVKLSREVPTNA